MARKRSRSRRQKRSFLRRNRLELGIALVCFGGALGFWIDEAEWPSFGRDPIDRLRDVVVERVGPPGLELRILDRSVEPLVEGGQPNGQPSRYRLGLRLELRNAGTDVRLPLPSAEFRDAADTVLDSVLCLPDGLDAAQLDPGETGGYRLRATLDSATVERLARVVLQTR